MFLAAQIISVIGMVLGVLSFQCKRNLHLVLMQGIASCFSLVSFLMLGGYDSAAFNLITILNMFFLMGEKTRGKLFFGIIASLSITGSLLTYAGPWTLMLLVQQLAALYTIWFCDGATIRKVRFFVVAPIWMVNNIFITFNIGGILCEIFAMSSVIISLIRYGKDGFTK